MSLNILDFSFLFLFVKIATPFLENVTPSQSWGPFKALPIFANLVGGSNPPPPPTSPCRKGGAHYGLYQSYIKTVLKLVSILIHGKHLKLSWSTRKEISKLLTITDQFHLFLFLVKFLRKSYLIPFLDTFKRIVFFVITNQVFNLLIHVSINYFLLFMIFMHLLIAIPQRCERDISWYI